MANKASSWLSNLVKPDGARAQRKSADSPDDADDAETHARARRREQVRRAQRTHRDRKAAYVKALEAEVAKLRGRDVVQQAELRRCRDAIHQLKDLIAAHGIALPAELAAATAVATAVDPPLATVELFGLPDHTQRLRAQMPEDALLDLSIPTSPAYPVASDTTMSSGSASTSPAAFPTWTPHPHGLNNTQVGVDFVLALEHGCLNHHSHSSVVSSGHKLMLISPIMRYAPAVPATQDQGQGQSVTGLPDGTSWTIPAVELERLLEYSERLDLDGEVTPVEAWRRIHLHPNFANLTRDGLEALCCAMVPQTQCYGFGAVIDESVFEGLLQSTLGPWA